jgi:hypothetical protein
MDPERDDNFGYLIRWTTLPLEPYVQIIASLETTRPGDTLKSQPWGSFSGVRGPGPFR